MTQLSLKPYSKIVDKPFEQEVKISIQRAEYNNVKFVEGSTTYQFEGCFFKKIIIESTEEIKFDDISLSFTGCFIEELEINKIESKNISISFLSSILSGRINDKNLKYVSLNNCILINNLFFLNLNSVSISFTEENIFPIRWKALFSRLRIKDFKNEINRKQSYYIHDCKRTNFYAKEKKSDKRGVYRRKLEHTYEYKVGYYLNDEQKSLFNINVDLRYNTVTEDSETQINNAFLRSLSIKGSPKGKISIESTKVDNWYISEFYPEGKVTFYDISPLSKMKEQTKIEFHKSNLDNTWFDNTNFSDYSTISFYRTKFAKSVFTSCNFPSSYTTFENFTSLENVHYPDRKKDNYYKDQYETFLQLKMSLEGTGNFYEAKKLQAVSSEALMKVEGLPRWDKLILCINSISNNHGLSIKEPFVLFLFFSILLYILYLFSLGRILNGNEVDFTLIGYYFSFIDITHRTDFLVEKDKFNLWSLLIDYLGKIFTGFFIYQFVAAFRKYGKW